MSGHKPRRPRWPAINNTMAVAQERASKLDQRSTKQLMQTITSAATALREGVATRLQWSIVAGSIDLALAIERQGVVRGLQEHLASAEVALKAIYTRATQNRQWQPTALYYSEIDAMQALISLHTFQLDQLSLAEYRRAVASASGQIRSAGDRVLVNRV